MTVVTARSALATDWIADAGTVVDARDIGVRVAAEASTAITPMLASVVVVEAIAEGIASLGAVTADAGGIDTRLSNAKTCDTNIEAPTGNVPLGTALAEEGTNAASWLNLAGAACGAAAAGSKLLCSVVGLA